MARTTPAEPFVEAQTAMTNGDWDERMEGVEMDGNRAWGTRHLAGGEAEDIGFIKRRGGWFIRLFARRPRATGRRPGL